MVDVVDLCAAGLSAAPEIVGENKLRPHSRSELVVSSGFDGLSWVPRRKAYDVVSIIRPAVSTTGRSFETVVQKKTWEAEKRIREIFPDADASPGAVVISRMSNHSGPVLLALVFFLHRPDRRRV